MAKTSTLLRTTRPLGLGLGVLVISLLLILPL
jgi:hypothetical protein